MSRWRASDVRYVRALYSDSIAPSTGQNAGGGYAAAGGFLARGSAAWRDAAATRIAEVLARARLSQTALQLRPEVIRAAYARWLQNGRRTDGGGLSPATIRKFHTVLRQALQTALDDGVVTRNVAAGLRLPKGDARQKRALKDEEMEALIVASQRTSLGAAVLVLLATGLRRGELLALTWPDVDFENNSIAVRRSRWRRLPPV